MSKYAISDIHGCLKTFEAMLDKIALTQSDTLMLLGDYVDRGPDSKGVIDLIMKLKTEGYQVQCLLGNHEHDFLKSLTMDKVKKLWGHGGGFQTLNSFGVELIEDVPQIYVDFMRNLPRYIESDGFIFCHAGLNFKYDNPFEDTEALIWERDWHRKISYQWLGERIIVHGHTPTNRADIQNMFATLDEGQFIDIDCGCFQADTMQDRGFLCCFDYENRALHFEKCIDEIYY
jgi:serine/threonine protein phosphatase 1